MLTGTPSSRPLELKLGAMNREAARRRVRLIERTTMSKKLKQDVKIGHGTFRKGVKATTAERAAKRLIEHNKRRQADLRKSGFIISTKAG
jgi:hypothetical protein